MNWRKRASTGALVVVLLCLVVYVVCLSVRSPVDISSLSGSWTGRDALTGARVDLLLRPDGTFEERLSDFRDPPEKARQELSEKVQSGEWSFADDQVVLHGYLVLVWQYGSDRESGTASHRVFDDWELRVVRGLLARWDALDREETIRFTKVPATD